jgi:hypothetical protein
MKLTSTKPNSFCYIHHRIYFCPMYILEVVVAHFSVDLVKDKDVVLGRKLELQLIWYGESML